MTGDIVLRRQFQRDDLLGRVWAAQHAGEDDHGLWLWVAGGAPFYDIAAADGRLFREVPFPDWGGTAKKMRELRWSTDVLMLHPHEGRYSVWFFFHPDGAFRSWYVNLEEPVTRWRDGELSGVDTVDQDLDIVVQPDRAWQWKDEEEFAEHLAFPAGYWVPDEAAVRAEGLRVVALIEAGAFPFDGSGTGFRPDPAWPALAEMPVGWDRPRAT